MPEERDHLGSLDPTQDLDSLIKHLPTKSPPGLAGLTGEFHQTHLRRNDTNHFQFYEASVTLRPKSEGDRALERQSRYKTGI